MRYVIGIDLGTSATKTILVDENGIVKGTAGYAYPMYEPRNGWAEQDPLDWRKAVLTTLKQVVEKTRVPAEDVKAIAFSGQMHGSVLIDKDGQPIGRTILWCDQRSSAQAEEMLKLLPIEKWLSITSNPPLAAWTAAKLLWIRENEPDVYGKMRHLLLPKDYIRLVLTGDYATDVSDATGMQMLDVRNRCWSDEVLDALKVDRSILGKLYESQEVTGHLLPEIAREVGLTPDTLVIAGGSDNACAGVGTGVVQEGQAFITLGTSSILYSHFDHYVQIPGGNLHMCCCAKPGGWHAMGGPISGGLSIEWFKNRFCRDLVAKASEEGRSFYDLMNELTEKIPLGSDRLIYLPFLMGERTPHMDPDYRGAFVGLNTVHTQAHMLRSIMEGIVYCLADCNDLLKGQEIQIHSLRVCGGGSRSPVFRRVIADLFRCDVHTLQQQEGGAAFGAAILAGVGAGIWPSIENACGRFIQEKDVTHYSEEEAERYEAYHRVYDRIYLSLKENFSELAGL